MNPRFGYFIISAKDSLVYKIMIWVDLYYLLFLYDFSGKLFNKFATYKKFSLFDSRPVIFVLGSGGLNFVSA